METSDRSVLRRAKERFNISKCHYFLFSGESGNGVIDLVASFDITYLQSLVALYFLRFYAVVYRDKFQNLPENNKDG